MSTAPDPRFDGATVFERLSQGQQLEIGGLALELMAAWYGQELALIASPHTWNRAHRVADAAADAASEALQQAFVLAVPRTELHDAEQRLRIPESLGPVCRCCGCSQNDACADGCAWAEADLCTACAKDGRS